jgi:hypothetical protein
VYDPGGEFVGIKFQTLLQDCHIRDVCTSAKYPQSNAICKRMHQTVGIVLRTLLHNEPQQNIADAKEFVDKALSIAMHAMRAVIHSTLGSSPGSLVFNRDMFLNIPWENRQNLHVFNLWPVIHHTEKNSCANPTPETLSVEIYTSQHDYPKSTHFY